MAGFWTPRVSVKPGLQPHTNDKNTGYFGETNEVFGENNFTWMAGWFWGISRIDCPKQAEQMTVKKYLYKGNKGNFLKYL